MTRPKMEFVGFRFLPAGLAWLNGMAEHYGVDRSTLIRACIRVAKKNPALLTKELKK